MEINNLLNRNIFIFDFKYILKNRNNFDYQICDMDYNIKKITAFPYKSLIFFIQYNFKTSSTKCRVLFILNIYYLLIKKVDLITKLTSVLIIKK